MNTTLINRVGEFIARWREVRKGARVLERFDDRMLADIGITRSQIHGAVRRGRYY